MVRFPEAILGSLPFSLALSFSTSHAKWHTSSVASESIPRSDNCSALVPIFGQLSRDITVQRLRYHRRCSKQINEIVMCSESETSRRCRSRCPSLCIHVRHKNQSGVVLFTLDVSRVPLKKHIGEAKIQKYASVCLPLADNTQLVSIKKTKRKYIYIYRDVLVVRINEP